MRPKRAKYPRLYLSAYYFSGSTRSIYARHACQDFRDDFIINCTQSLRHLLGGKSRLSLSSDQDYLVTYTRLRNVRDIDDALVHADPTRQRRVLPVFPPRRSFDLSAAE